MRVADFDYDLPTELIAQYPLPQRSASRLLCVSRQTGELAHRQFQDLPHLLQPGDLLVFNNTRVMPARLYAQKSTGGRCEILIERLIDTQHAWAHVRASKAPKAGTVLHLAAQDFLTVQARDDDLFLLQSTQPFAGLLAQYGHLPLPPYVQRAEETLDQERYQTVYAATLGAVAAPTAGLHFDDTILATLAQQHINSAYLTLHVGAGTFQPVRVENILEHKMHYEYAEVPDSVCQCIRQTKTRGHRVIAVGTTCVRSLETAALRGTLQAFAGETNLFIYPGFKFQVIDGMLTNFHLPKSTLLMLVAAFAGREAVFKAYYAAIAQRYRFFSYGDAMLLL